MSSPTKRDRQSEQVKVDEWVKTHETKIDTGLKKTKTKAEKRKAAKSFDRYRKRRKRTAESPDPSSIGDAADLWLGSQRGRRRH